MFSRHVSDLWSAFFHLWVVFIRNCFLIDMTSGTYSINDFYRLALTPLFTIMTEQKLLIYRCVIINNFNWPVRTHDLTAIVRLNIERDSSFVWGPVGASFFRRRPPFDCCWSWLTIGRSSPMTAPLFT
jgi:hypothetical protein